MLKKTKIIPIVLLLIMVITAMVTILYVHSSNDIVTPQVATSALNEVSPSDWDASRVTVVYDTEGVAVPVPNGFVASGADGEHTVKTGFVIYEGTDAVTTSNANAQSKIRNQWVWIPVSDPSRIYEESDGKKTAKLWSFSSSGRTRLLNDGREPDLATEYDTVANLVNNGLIGTTPNGLYQELQTEFDATIESIKKYGGFYIGRYETGNMSASHREPVIQRLNDDIDYVCWYGSYTKLKNLNTNANIKANILWGCLRDETLQWLYETGNKTYAQLASDSTSWGNYYNSSFTYTTTSGGTATRSSGKFQKVPTGSTERHKANNIYDLAGNMWEVTMEAWSSSCRRYCGGSGGDYGYSSPAAFCGTGTNDVPTLSDSSTRCSRVLLYQVRKIFDFSYALIN